MPGLVLPPAPSTDLLSTPGCAVPPDDPTALLQSLGSLLLLFVHEALSSSRITLSDTL